MMKRAIIVVVAFAILFNVLLFLNHKDPIDFRSALGWVEGLGEAQPPSLLGGHSYSEGFAESSKASIYLVSYPIRWAYFVGGRVFYTVRYFFGGSVEGGEIL